MVRLGLSQQRQRGDKTVTVVPQIEKLTLTRWGVQFQVNTTPLGLRVRDLAKHTEALESKFVADFMVRKIGHGQAAVEARHSDPLARPVPVETLPAATRHLHIVSRVAEDGTGVEQDIILPELVIGGQGSGKSTELWVRLNRLLEAGVPFRLRVFDPKGGMELGALRNAAYDYDDKATAWPEFLGRALVALEGRQRSLAGRGWQKLFRFTDRDPLDIMLVDELLAVLAMRNRDVKIGKTGTMKAGDAFDLYLSQARAAGFTVWALSQLGQKELIGNARGLFPHLTVMRVPPSEKEIVGRLLGDADAYPAHEIPPGPRFAGVGFTRLPEGRVVRCRGAALTDEQRAAVVSQVAAATERMRGDRSRPNRQQQPRPAGES